MNRKPLSPRRARAASAVVFGFLAGCALPAAPRWSTPARADDAPVAPSAPVGNRGANRLVPQAGQIGFKGKLGAVGDADAAHFTLIVESFTTAAGKEKKIAPTAKKIALMPDAVVTVNGQRQRDFSFATLPANAQMTVVGPDKAPGAGAAQIASAVDILFDAPVVARVADKPVIPIEALNNREVAIPEYANHPIAPEGHAIPAILEEVVHPIAFKDIKQDPNRVYMHREILMVIPMGHNENKSPSISIGADHNMTEFKGALFALTPNVLDKTVFDPSGKHDRDSFYLNSVTIWDETVNKPVNGDIIYDTNSNSLALRVKNGSWDEWAGHTVTIRATITVSTLTPEVVDRFFPGTGNTQVTASNVNFTPDTPLSFQKDNFTLTQPRAVDPNNKSHYEPEFLAKAKEKNLLIDANGSLVTRVLNLIDHLGPVTHNKLSPNGVAPRLVGVLDGLYGECGVDTGLFTSLAKLAGVPSSEIVGYTRFSEKDSGEYPLSHLWARVYTELGPVDIDLTKKDDSLNGAAQVKDTLFKSTVLSNFKFNTITSTNTSFDIDGEKTSPSGLGSMANFYYRNKWGSLSVLDFQPDTIKSVEIK